MGSCIGLEATPLVLQRCEEGLEKPLHQWRDELGVQSTEGEQFGAKC